MSEDPADRLLEYALGKVLDGTEEPDLAERVTQAWQQGQRGTYRPPEPLRAVPRRPAPPLVPPAFRQPQLAVAAILLLLSLAGALWWLGRSEGGPGASERLQSSRVVRRAQVGSGREAEGTWIQPGEIVLVQEQPVELALDQGGTLRLGPGTRLYLRTLADFELLAGDIVLEGSPGSVDLRALGCVVAPAPNAHVSLRVQFPEGAPADWLDLLDPGDRPRRLRLSVLGGSVSGSDPRGEALALSSGSLPWTFVLPVPDAVGRERLARLAADLFFELPEVWMGLDYRELGDERFELTALLAERPELWDTLAALVREHERASLPTFERLLTFLQGEPAPAANELVRELWSRVPEAFSDGVLVTFAERGVAEFEDELLALLELHDGKAPTPVMAAAWAALRGRRESEPILSAVLEERGTKGSREARFLAAFALDHLDGGEAWEVAREEVRAQVESSLERSDLLAATDLVLGLEFYERLFERREVRLGTLPEELREHRAARRNELQSARDVRALLDGLPR